MSYFVVYISYFIVYRKFTPLLALKNTFSKITYPCLSTLKRIQNYCGKKYSPDRTVDTSALYFRIRRRPFPRERTKPPYTKTIENHVVSINRKNSENIARKQAEKCEI